MPATCPRHGVELTLAPWGDYTCPTKVGIGQPNTTAKGFCNYKVKGAAVAAQFQAASLSPGPGAIGLPGASQGPSATSGTSDRSAALAFAGSVYRGAGHFRAEGFDPDEEALGLAEKALAWLRMP